MKFGAAVASAYKKTFVFSGRASRSEYWWFFLFSAILSTLIVAGFIIRSFAGLDINATEEEAGSAFLSAIIPAIGLCWLTSGLPAVALGFRRLHDIGQPGWWIGVQTTLQIFTAISFYTALSGGGDAASVAGATGLTISSGLMNILQVITLIMTIVPSQPFANKYGEPTVSVQD
jgi:hypothetical protein